MNAFILCMVNSLLISATQQTHYYAYDTVEDEYGVIAPWYQEQNGQFDFRVRIAAETLKRYPWAVPPKSVLAGPEYIFNGTWRIASDGSITVPPLRDWDNGDLGQRAAYLISGLVDYYRYSGDAAALGIITLQIDYLLDYCQTGPDHPWPNFLISVPTLGMPYGKCNPGGMIQLDIVAEVGLAVLKAYQLTGNTKWLEACAHWGNLLAVHRNQVPGKAPWNRYANPEHVKWDDQMTGGVVYLLFFFDELIKLGYNGEADSILQARDTALNYLQTELLPQWTVDDVWGRNYWDWWDSVQAANVTEFTARYMMERPELFPNWKTDVRNILTLFFNRTSVSKASGGDVYSGAWAYPESSGCCGRSLWYGPLMVATPIAEYGVCADDDWARELARRQQILATYDCHTNGVVEDNIDGGMIVAGSWFKITHPFPLKYVLETMAWLPEVFGPNRENHVMRSASVVTSVSYKKGRIEYRTFDAPLNGIDVLRLAFRPTRITADDKTLSEATELNANGYTVQLLEGGDFIVKIRHDRATRILVEGPDPQEIAPASDLEFSGSWHDGTESEKAGGRIAEENGAAFIHRFTGNQVRLIGAYSPEGGLADVYLDGDKQLPPIDCWSPYARADQLLYYRNGLSNDAHELKVVVRGEKNPVSTGTGVAISEVQWSAAAGDSGFGSGGGPTATQRMILGYSERNDYIDTNGNTWRPCTEWCMRSDESLADIVTKAWWTKRRRIDIAGSPDPELYRYGAHGPEFWINVTVGPGTYYVKLLFAETRIVAAKQRAVSISINGEKLITDMDVALTANGLNRSVDIVLNEIQPERGVIEIRLLNHYGGEAMLQAIEVGPGNGGEGTKPLSIEKTAE